MNIPDKFVEDSANVRNAYSDLLYELNIEFIREWDAKIENKGALLSGMTTVISRLLLQQFKVIKTINKSDFIIEKLFKELKKGYYEITKEDSE